MRHTLSSSSASQKPRTFRPRPSRNAGKSAPQRNLRSASQNAYCLGASGAHHYNQARQFCQTSRRGITRGVDTCLDEVCEDATSQVAQGAPLENAWRAALQDPTESTHPPIDINDPPGGTSPDRPLNCTINMLAPPRAGDSPRIIPIPVECPPNSERDSIPSDDLIHDLYTSQQPASQSERFEPGAGWCREANGASYFPSARQACDDYSSLSTPVCTQLLCTQANVYMSQGNPAPVAWDRAMRNLRNKHTPPTQDPTQGPSRPPSKAPSKSPTQGPTGLPSEAPSKSPSQGPTGLPSEAPSKNPTQGPSQLPSKAPSKRPTQDPTGLPSKAPSKRPTQDPTRRETTRYNSAPYRSSQARNTVGSALSPYPLSTLKITSLATSMFTSQPDISRPEERYSSIANPYSDAPEGARYIVNDQSSPTFEGNVPWIVGGVVLLGLGCAGYQLWNAFGQPHSTAETQTDTVDLNDESKRDDSAQESTV